jgi:hypothetical protein
MANQATLLAGVLIGGGENEWRKKKKGNCKRKTITKINRATDSEWDSRDRSRQHGNERPESGTIPRIET